MGALCLSVEELALALALSGHEEMARALMLLHFGELSEAEGKARLTAAAHGLIARDLGSFSFSKGELSLSEAFQQVLKIVTAPDYSIRFSRVSNGEDVQQVYHWRGEEMVLQQVKDGVAYLLQQEREPQTTHMLLTGGSDLFHLQEEGEATEVEMLLETFDRLTRPPSDTPSREATPPPVISYDPQLVKDLAAPAFRGSVLRVEYRENQPVSDYGCLVIGGERTAWLCRLLPQEQKVVIRSGLVRHLREEIELLRARKYRL